MNTGHKVSAVLHGGLILWVMLFDLFSAPDSRMDTTVTEVALISTADFDALNRSSPPAPAPPAIAPPPPAPAPPEPTPPVAEPIAPPPPVAEPPPPVAQPTPPTPEPPTPPQAAVIAPALAPDASLRPQQRARIDRVAPQEAPEQTQPVPTAPRDVAVATPAPVPATPTPPAPEAAARPPAVTETVTEATQIVPDEPARRTATAPEVSIRPERRPARPTVVQPTTPPAPATQTAAVTPPRPAVPTPAPTPPAAPTGPSSDAVNSALAEAMAEAMGGGEADARSLDQSSIDGLRLNIESCWNVGLLSTDALSTRVTIAFEMARDSRPIPGSIQLAAASGGTSIGQQQAFEAGRAAILTCGEQGYGLPGDLYDLWRQVEITFNPSQMSLR